MRSATSTPIESLERHISGDFSCRTLHAGIIGDDDGNIERDESIDLSLELHEDSLDRFCEYSAIFHIGSVREVISFRWFHRGESYISHGDIDEVSC